MRITISIVPLEIVDVLKREFPKLAFIHFQSNEELRSFLRSYLEGPKTSQRLASRTYIDFFARQSLDKQTRPSIGDPQHIKAIDHQAHEYTPMLFPFIQRSE